MVNNSISKVLGPFAALASLSVAKTCTEDIANLLQFGKYYPLLHPISGTSFKVERVYVDGNPSFTDIRYTGFTSDDTIVSPCELWKHKEVTPDGSTMSFPCIDYGGHGAPINAPLVTLKFQCPEGMDPESCVPEIPVWRRN